jgi:hypothetical protein
MFVGVAARTISGKAKICAVQIFHKDADAFGLGDICRFVAIIAVHLGVLARQGKACLTVIDCFPAGLPVNQWKVSACMLAVAFHTVNARGSWRQPHGVHAFSASHALPDLAVAVHAAELLDSGSQVVALGAIQWPGEWLMRF